MLNYPRAWREEVLEVQGEGGKKCLTIRGNLSYNLTTNLLLGERRIASGSTYVNPLFYSMQIEDTLKLIKERIAPVLKRSSAVAVEVSLKKAAGAFILRILADKPGGITVGDCACLNRDISRLIEDGQLLKGKYTLEVSSPGLDRPLKEAGDFKRAEGKTIDIWLSKPINDKNFISGNIEKANEEDISVLDKSNNQVRIRYSNINKARRKV